MDSQDKEWFRDDIYCSWVVYGGAILIGFQFMITDTLALEKRT